MTTQKNDKDKAKDITQEGIEKANAESSELSEENLDEVSGGMAGRPKALTAKGGKCLCIAGSSAPTASATPIDI
jgi:hypothetical protein